MANCYFISGSNNSKESSNIFNIDNEYNYLDELKETSEEYPIGSQFALLLFENSIHCQRTKVTIIGSKLDSDIS
jgi:hypothetical protein